jgi:NAD(P)-dependent dehydrogenase (short-subunit alcohol dehydrogenase family)
MSFKVFSLTIICLFCYYIDDIVEKSGNLNISVKKLDLSSLDSVRQFAADILKNEPKLHILINNAGCAMFEKKMTKDGLECQMQTNYFGHFLLTNLLIGMIFT